MNLFMKLLPLTLILNICTGSQSKAKTKDVMELETDRIQVLEVTRQLTQLMIDRDLVELNKILDTHFTLTHITGYVPPKEEWLSEIE
jgi:hypothetical protein